MTLRLTSRFSEQLSVLRSHVVMNSASSIQFSQGPESRRLDSIQAPDFLYDSTHSRRIVFNDRSCSR